MKYKTAFFMAWGNFISIPCPSRKWDHEQRGLMLVFMPVIGLMIGVLWYGLWLLLNLIGISIFIKAAVLTAYPFIVSGLMHLDGFMDCCDAILSRKPLEERQRILKDSNVGAFSVVSVVMLFMMFYGAMCGELQLGAGIFMSTSGDFPALIFVPLISRAMSARAVLRREPLGHSQYADLPGEKKKGYARACLLIAVLAQIIPMAVILGSPYGFFEADKWLLLQSFFAVFCIVNIAHGAALLVAKNQLGGMSGDVSGFAITISELAAIVTLGII